MSGDKSALHEWVQLVLSATVAIIVVIILAVAIVFTVFERYCARQRLAVAVPCAGHRLVCQTEGRAASRRALARRVPLEGSVAPELSSYEQLASKSS